MLKKVGGIYTEDRKNDSKLINLRERAGYTICFVNDYGCDGSEFMFMEEIEDGSNS